MARGAATQEKLGALHAKIAGVFEKVLETYSKRLDALGNIDTQDLEAELLKELFADDAMPNPAMLNAITAFLKNNEIRFDSDEVSRVSALKDSLAARRAQRGNVIELTTLQAVGE